MADQYWLNEQLKNDDGFGGNTQSQQDDQLMSSFLNYLDGDGNNPGADNSSINSNQLKNNNGTSVSSSGNGPAAATTINNFNQNVGSIGSAGANEPNVDSGVSPATMMNMMQQQQNQLQQRQGGQMQQSPQQQMPQVQMQQQQQSQSQRSSQDTNALIQKLLSERNNNQLYQQQQAQQQQHGGQSQPQSQQGGFPPDVFSPTMGNQTIPPQVPQQVPTPQLQQQNVLNQIQNMNQQRQQTPQFNSNLPMDKAAMIAALQQRNSQNPERFQQQQQFLQQQQMMNQQQQQQQQQQQNSMSPNMNNQGLSSQQQQQHMFQQLQQQQALRLQQLQQQQRQQQQQGSIGGMPNQSPMGQDIGINSPMITNQIPPQNQFNPQFSGPNQVSRNGTPFQQQQQAQQRSGQSMNMQGPGSQHPSVPNTPQQPQRVLSNSSQQVPQQRPPQAQAPQVGQQLPVQGQGAAQQGQQGQQGMSADQLQQQRKLQQQISATQIELFMKTLTDFMRNRGTPINSNPIIADKRIHLFFFYAIVARLGGSSSVSRQQQWGFVAQKLALPVDQNHQVARDLAKAYIDYLLPFEQYASTPEGQKDLQSRRQNIQKQHEALLRQLKQGQPSPQVQQQAPVQPQPQVPQQSSAQPTPSQTSQHISPQIAQRNTPHTQPSAQVPTPTQQQFQRVTNLNQNPGSNAASPVNTTPQQQPQPQPQQQFNQQFQAPQLQKQRSGSQRGSIVASPLVDAQNQNQQSPAPQNDEPAKPNVIRNYVPDQRIIEQHAGYDVKSLNQLGEQIDSAKPIFLFAPELGAVSIHALSMSLDSGIQHEVNTALNTALVTSADSALTIPLIECPEFLESLSCLGLRVLDQLLQGSDSRDVMGVEEINLEDLTSKTSNIDDIFNKYVNNEDDAHEVEIQIDSFTGEPAESDSEVHIKDEDSVVVDADEEMTDAKPLIDELKGSRSASVEIAEAPSSFGFPSYVEMLIDIRHESEQPFSKIHTKSANDSQVLLVDQLTTISMVLRNISFYEHNAASLASNDFFKEFLFKLVNSIATMPEKFVYTRRRLGFLKDSLVTLVNIAHLLQLRSHNDVITVIALVLSFGPEQKEEKGSIFIEYNPSSHKYQNHGVDVLAKLLVRDPPNRSFFNAVLTGNYDANAPFAEVEENKKLISVFTGVEENPHLDLLSRVFKYLISVIPLTSLGLNTIIHERDPVILQSLIATILLIDILPTEGEHNLALEWLSGPECLGNGLIRLGLVLAAIASKPGDNDSLRLISARSFTLVNSLIQKSFEYVDNGDDDLSVFNKTKLHLPSDAVLGALLTSIDPSILNQILTLSEFLKKINSAAVLTDNQR